MFFRYPPTGVTVFAPLAPICGALGVKNFIDPPSGGSAVRLLWLLVLNRRTDTILERG